MEGTTKMADTIAASTATYSTNTGATNATTVPASSAVDGTKNESISPAEMEHNLRTLKLANDKLAKEAAEAKRALRARQTDEEAAKESEEIRQATISEELEKLRKQVAHGDNAKRLMGVGMDEATAGTVAEGLYGAFDMDGVIYELKRFLANREKTIKAELMKLTPRAAQAGMGEEPSITKEQFDSLPYQDRVRLYSENRNLYNQYTGGK